MKIGVFGARLGLLSCAMGSVFPLYAQNSQGSLPPVMVTASRHEQAVDQAPIGATVLLGEDIVAAAMADANEAVRKLGGVVGRRDLNGGHDDALDIRGYGDSAISNLVVMVDGIRISENELAGASLSAISAEMIDRIEIIRGGASVLWGEGATSGVIHVITRAGKRDGVHGLVKLAGESYGGLTESADLTYKAADFKLYAQANNTQTDGYRKNGANQETSVNTGVQVGDANTLLTKFSAFSDVSHMRWAGAITVDQFAVDATQTTNPKDAGMQQLERYGLAFEKKWSNVTLTLDLANRQRHTSGVQFWGAPVGDTTETRSTTNQVSPRILMTTESDGVLLNALVGVDWQQWDYDYAFIDPVYPGTGRGSQSSGAVYAKLDTVSSGGWRFDAGVRNETFTQTIQNVTYGTSVGSAPNLTASNFGVSRSLSPQWSVYSRVAASYRIANVDELRYLSTPLLPQQTRDVEIGMNYRHAADSVALRVFRQSTTNEIAYDNSIYSNINLDPVARRGLEVEAATAIAKTVRLSGSAQWMDALLSSGAYAGSQVPLAAHASLSARSSYTPDDTNTFDASLRWIGPRVFGNDWSNQCNNIPASTFVDLGYQFRQPRTANSGWTLRLGVDNLADQRTYSAGYTNSSCSAYNVYPDLGRVVKFSGTYNF